MNQSHPTASLRFFHRRLTLVKKKFMQRRGCSNVAFWHKAAIDSVVWKVRKGSKRSFAAPATNGSNADKAAVRTERAECHFRPLAVVRDLRLRRSAAS
jgi:hypothetical protein